MVDENKAFRVFTYIFEIIFFIAGVVFMFSDEPSISMSSFAISEICRLHRNIQNLSIILNIILRDELNNERTKV